LLSKNKVNLKKGAVQMSWKKNVLIGVVIAVIIACACLSHQIVGFNNAQNWQVVQGIGGNISVNDKAGYFMKNFATVTTYPRYVEATYDDVEDEGENDRESVRATFNDGGTAQISTYVRFETPTVESQRKIFHQQFAGNMNNARNAVKAHLINCIKATAPLMSASENQSARKAEFALVIDDMLSSGLYDMKKVERILKDRTDEKGNPITVYATEIINDEKGMPVIAQVSPLIGYGIVISQFSVTEIEYDDEIKAQFMAKKESFLAAEKSKAQREEMVQERLMIIEKGNKDKAAQEAESNVIMMKAVIEASQKANVALQVKIENETKAAMGLSVAEIEKKQALTVANKQLEVAQVMAKAAEQTKIATIAEAEGRQKSIELSGAITEKDRVLAQIKADRDVQVAKYLAEIKTPSIVFNGSGNSDSSGTTQSLMNIALLKAAGLLDKDFNVNDVTVPVETKK
jgi:hypothetical protein